LPVWKKLLDIFLNIYYSSYRNLENKEKRMSYSRTVTCSFCWTSGHNRRSCSDLQTRMEERLEKNADDWYAKKYFEKKSAGKGKQKSCGYCAFLGHTRRTCKELKYAKETAVKLCTEWRKKLVAGLKELGIGIGTLIRYTRYDKKEIGMIMAIRWRDLDHRIEFEEGSVYSLEVRPIHSFSDPYERPIRFPAIAGVVPVENRIHHRQNVEVVGAITAEEVETMIPKDFYQAEDCLADIFEEHKKPDYRTVPGEIKEWCSLQGFYTEGVA
jgi:hypothetical protein